MMMAYDIPPAYSAEQIDAMSEREHKTYESRLRRAARRQALELVKSRARDEHSVDFGTYRLVDQRSNAVVFRDWDAPGSYGATLTAVAEFLFSRQVREDDEARRLARLYPNSVDVSIMGIRVNGVLVVAIATRLADDIRAMEFGKRNLDEVLDDIVQHATPVPDNALLHESRVAARLGGAPRRVLIEQYGRNAARIDYAS